MALVRKPFRIYWLRGTNPNTMFLHLLALSLMLLILNTLRQRASRSSRTTTNPGMLVLLGTISMFCTVGCHNLQPGEEFRVDSKGVQGTLLQGFYCLGLCHFLSKVEVFVPGSLLPCTNGPMHMEVGQVQQQGCWGRGDGYLLKAGGYCRYWVV